MSTTGYYTEGISSRTRANTQSPKRRSVFGGRSRSNTSTSTLSSHQSPATSMTSTDISSRRSSQDGHTVLSTGFPPSDRQEGVAKSLFSRSSRILRRQGSKFSISSTLILDEHEEFGGEKQKLDVPEFFHRSHKVRHSDTHDLLKKNISDPFDFQHVTHTNSSQYRSLDTENKDRLVSEFSALRASQRPNPELKGIAAQSLLFRNFSSEDLRSRNLSDMNNKGPRSLPPNTPPESPDPQGCATAPVDSGAEWKKQSRCFENFSRPVSRIQKAPVSPSIVPPPRVSSRLACSDIPEPTCQTIDALLGLQTPSTFPEFVHSTTDDKREDDSSLSQLDLAEVFRPDVGHAFTTTDSSAKLIKSPPMTSYPSDLADVPEDSETSFPLENEPRKSKTSPEFNLKPTQPSSTPSFHRLSPKARQSIGGLDQSPEPIGSPTIPGYRFGFEQSQRAIVEDTEPLRPEEIGTAIDENWEDDIDYCYEHAAESNSNFDWGRSSLDGPEFHSSKSSNRYRVPVLDLPKQNNRESMNPPRSVPCEASPWTLATPPLEPGSALSPATTHDAVTPLSAVEPSELFRQGKHNQKSECFKAESQSFIASGLGNEMSQEAIYEELISGNDESRHHITFYPLSEDQTLESTSSPRSGGSPISKCNSQESMILSRAGSIARKHRSSVSTTSVPELVHSTNGSCETMDRDTSSINDDQTTFIIPDSNPPSSSHSSSTHQRNKSLARETSQTPSHKDVPNNEHVDKEIPVPTITLSHDRAKSASAFEAHISAAALKAAGPPPATRARSSTMTRTTAPNRKTRTSYSLFPTSQPISK